MSAAPRCFRTRAVLAALLLAAFTPQGASAQPAQAPTPAAAPVVTLPVLEGAPEVLYPEGAQGEAEVVLVLVIQPDGAVASVEVDRGDEPFASVAKASALTFHFSPATRDGKPVSARIRYAITFREPAPEEPIPESLTETTQTPEKPPPAAPQKQKVQKVIEVVVLGDRPAPTARTITRAEVRQLPGAFGDPFRAIEVLPGVTPIVSGLPYFYVRGAPPGNVGYFLDGVRVPYLFHVAAGPSVVHPAVVDRVDLYSGGYPARYGRFAGAVVAAETKEPEPDTHGEGVLRLVDVGALVEAPFDEGRGKALVGGRYSYTAAVISLLAPELTLDYRDYQLRVAYDLTPHDRLTLFAFGAYDLLAETKNDIKTVLFGSEFYRADLRYDVFLPDDGKLRWAATVGFDQTRIADQRNARDILGGMRMELALPVSPEATLRGGMDMTLDQYRADQAPYGDPEDPDVEAYNELFPNRSDGAAGAWLDVVYRPLPELEVTPGLRIDHYRSGAISALGVDPRLSVRLEVTPELRMLEAFGVAHQPPSFVVPVPGLALANLEDGLQTSLQAASGVELDLPYNIVGSLTFFQDIFLDMTDTAGLAPPGDDRNQAPRSQGTSHGIEVYMRRNLTSSLGGFLSYTLSESTRTVSGITIPFAFDRTHVFHTALSYDLGRGWRAGGRFTFYSGIPSQDTRSGVSELERLSNPPREPSYYRVDVRFEKKWTFSETTWLSLVLEALNATLHKEYIRGQEIGPVTIPSFGVEGGF